MKTVTTVTVATTIADSHCSDCNYCSDINFAAKNGHIDCIKRFNIDVKKKLKTPILNAAKEGHLDCLIYLHKNNYPFHKNVCLYAIIANQFDCLKYLIENGCEFSKTSYTPISKGNLDIIKYLCENGYVYDIVLSCKIASKKGNLEMFKYFYEKSDDSTNRQLIFCNTIYFHKNLKCIKYLIEVNCPFQDDICAMAVQKKNSLINYLHTVNHKFQKDIFYYACYYGITQLVKKLLKSKYTNLEKC